MQPEIKNCQNCKKDFVIEPDDFLFYEKMKVPPPTFCPHCRMIRRMQFGNFSTFYKKKCESCGKLTICLYNPNENDRMYCNPCWWSDNWDGTEYGVDYDFSKTFFDQLIELRKKSIFQALEILYPSNINSKYTNNSGYQKDSFMTIYSDYSEHCAYITITAHNKDLLDCYRAKNSELCYECIGINKSYNCKWSEELDNCVNCNFCQSCYGCNDCIGSANLRNKSYYIFNIKYSKEDYIKKLKELKIDTYDGQQNIKREAEKFWMKYPKRYYHGNSLNINVTGEYVYESKNTKESYLVSGVVDSKYTQYLTMEGTKDCYDYTGWGNVAELLYECYTVGEGAYNNKFSAECWPEAHNLEYCFYCIQSKDCFGCVNLKRKQYCILNKQYTKEEYFKLKKKIIENMDENPYINNVGHIYKYGEFFPPELSPFSYNESITQDYYPLSKDEALSFGYNWADIKENKYNITCKGDSLPQKINDIDKSIEKEVIQCTTCNKAYNISSIEVELLSKFNQPLPRSCSTCRHMRRFKRTNKPVLYDRFCNKCNSKIRTSYSPDRPEIVYCEKCYQAEVY